MVTWQGDLGSNRWPTDVIMTANGEVLHRTVSPQDPRQYISMLDQVAAHFRVRGGTQFATNRNFQTSNTGYQPTAPGSTPTTPTTYPQNGHPTQQTTTAQGCRSSLRVPTDWLPRRIRHRRLRTVARSAQPALVPTQPNPAHQPPTQNGYFGGQPTAPAPQPTQPRQPTQQPQQPAPNTSSQIVGYAPAYGNQVQLNGPSAPALNGPALSGPTAPPSGYNSAPPSPYMPSSTTSVAPTGPGPNISNPANTPVTSTSEPSAPPKKPTAKETEYPVALDGYCPVTLVEDNRWVRADPQWGARHRRRTYLFSSPEQQQKFHAAA